MRRVGGAKFRIQQGVDHTCLCGKHVQRTDVQPVDFHRTDVAQTTLCKQCVDESVPQQVPACSSATEHILAYGGAKA